MKFHKELMAGLLLTSTLVQAQEVPKDQWVSAMKDILPTAFCNADAYFRQCFKVDAVKCEEVAVSATRNCLDKYDSQIPASLSQPQDGTRWGTAVGQCAGEAYEVTLMDKRTSTAKCNDPAQWQ
ncbi:MAG: hypothetical protein ACK5ME_11185 [Parahaliea sp.]